MKTGIFAGGVILLVVTLVSVNSFMLNKTISGFIEDAEKIKTSDAGAVESAMEIKKRFEEAERFVSLTVNHEDLTNIEQCYAELIGFLTVGMTNEAEVTKSRLIDALMHLRRLSGVNIDSII